MNSIGIVTDSHSGIDGELAQKLGVTVLPMPFYIDGKCYYEGSTITREAFLRHLQEGADVATSQPSPSEVMEVWDRMLEKYDKILYMPISSGLSSSCEVARGMAREEPYAGRVVVIDTGCVSTPLLRSVMDAVELVGEGYDAEEIREIIERNRGNMVVYVGFRTLEYLKRGGRVTPATAALGTLLNIKPVLRMELETMDAVKRCHGFIKARHFMIDIMRHDLETRFKEQYAAGEVRLLAASSTTPEETADWVEEIKAAFPGEDVLSGDLSMGTCCHIGPGALGIGCSCRPRRP